MAKKDSGEPIMVAAIDFGTTFSGFAFSFRHEFEQDPLKVTASQWLTGSRVAISLKTSSCILFDKHKKFAAFGFEAEDKYSDLTLDGLDRDWYYFRRFKMHLYNSQDVHRTTMIPDESGKQMLALDVFSEAIGYLKRHVMKSCDDRGFGLSEREIKWVLTVPAIWGDAAKQFMRRAAEQGGIPSERLSLALEPEAASLFCKYLPVERLEGKHAATAITCFRPGAKYLVLDAGGGTIDITVHMVQPDQSLKELFKANGGPWGGTTVDKAFLGFLENIVGKEVIEKFRNDHKEDFIDLMREFEVKKRSVEPGMTSKVTIKIPIAMHELYREIHDSEIRESVRNNPKLNEVITLAGDKLRVEAHVMKGMFEETCDTIVKHLKEIYKEPAVQNTDTILMVGGFSESPMVRNAIEKGFPDKRVIVPHEAGLAVLKGAVIYGHNEHVIRSRSSRYTYGIKTYNDFIPGVHPESRKVIKKNGKASVRGVFNKLVEAGQEVSLDDNYQGKEFCPFDKRGTGFKIKLFATQEKDPVYVDDQGCVPIGEVYVDCRDRKGNVSGAYVTLVFGGTELEVRAVNSETGELTAATFDFLE